MTFVDVFDAREWELLADGAWVRNRYTNEYILLDRFSEESINGILEINKDIDSYPILFDRNDTLTSYLLSKSAS